MCVAHVVHEPVLLSLWQPVRLMCRKCMAYKLEDEGHLMINGMPHNRGFKPRFSGVV